GKELAEARLQLQMANDEARGDDRQGRDEQHEPGASDLDRHEAPEGAFDEGHHVAGPTFRRWNRSKPGNAAPIRTRDSPRPFYRILALPAFPVRRETAPAS